MFYFDAVTTGAGDKFLNDAGEYVPILETIIIAGNVATYANLPTASSYTGKYYIVDADTGVWLLGTLKKAGLYKSNGTNWVYIDNIPETTSLSDGTTIITGTNIILEGGTDITTTTDIANNKITIASTAYTNSDIDTALTNGLALKVDKVTGKGLSTEDYTTAEKNKLANQSGTNTGDETTSSIKTKLGITTLSGSNTGDQDLSNYATIVQVEQAKLFAIAMAVAL